MKVYFMASPRGKDELAENYSAIYEAIKESGYENVTDFILDVEVEEFYISDIKRFYRHTVDDLKSADVCIFETSTNSMAIGHLLSMAIEKGKPIIALYVKGKTPFFLSGIDTDKVQLIEYDLSNLKQEISQALEYATDQQDTRFNFFISPKHQQYMDWVSKHKKVPRAVFLRKLIEEDMRKHPEFS